MPGGEWGHLISSPQRTHSISRKDEGNVGYSFLGLCVPLQKQPGKFLPSFGVRGSGKAAVRCDGLRSQFAWSLWFINPAFLNFKGPEWCHLECRSQKINGVPWSEVNMETMRPRRKGWVMAESGVRFPPGKPLRPFRSPSFALPTSPLPVPCPDPKPREAALRDCPVPCERTECSLCEHSAESKILSVTFSAADLPCVCP